MIKHTIAVLGALALGGCYSMQGSERILDRDGYIAREVPDSSIFRNDFARAFQARQAGFALDQHTVDAMLSSGFTHIYSYCDNYFDVMGMQQRRSRVTRDSIAPITSLITGVIAMHNFTNDPGGKEDVLAALGLATGATSSMLDIYDQHMLFGAENIGAVETLTLKAINVHSALVLAFDDVTYDSAVRHLLKNQSICSPQHILLLTREAIKEGNVVARTPEGNDRPGIAESGDSSDRTVEISIENQ